MHTSRIMLNRLDSFSLIMRSESADKIPKYVLGHGLKVLEFMQIRGSACPGDLEEIFSYEGTTAFLLFYMLEHEGLIESVDPENVRGVGHYFKVKSPELVDYLSKKLKEKE